MLVSNWRHPSPQATYRECKLSELIAITWFLIAIILDVINKKTGLLASSARVHSNFLRKQNLIT